MLYDKYMIYDTYLSMTLFMSGDPTVPAHICLLAQSQRKYTTTGITLCTSEK